MTGKYSPIQKNYVGENGRPHTDTLTMPSRATYHATALPISGAGQKARGDFQLTCVLRPSSPDKRVIWGRMFDYQVLGSGTTTGSDAFTITAMNTAGRFSAQGEYSLGKGKPSYQIKITGHIADDPSRPDSFDIKVEPAKSQGISGYVLSSLTSPAAPLFKKDLAAFNHLINSIPASICETSGSSKLNNASNFAGVTPVGRPGPRRIVFGPQR